MATLYLGECALATSIPINASSLAKHDHDNRIDRRIIVLRPSADSSWTHDKSANLFSLPMGKERSFCRMQDDYYRQDQISLDIKRIAGKLAEQIESLQINIGLHAYRSGELIARLIFSKAE